jgi:D-sedoheptulose 7-phosphate isomerase
VFSIKDYIDGGIQTLTKIYYNEAIRQDIQSAADLLIGTFKNDRQLLVCGNGGSAADAQHFAAELMPMGLRAIALTTDTSALTAIGNDDEFATIFSRQVMALGRPGGVLLGLSTSGKSVNVRMALGNAKLIGMDTIAMTGAKGLLGSVKPTITIRVPSTDTQHIQEAHVAIYHMLWLMVKEAL